MTPQAATKRPRKPRPELGIVPVSVTQYSAYQITGLPPRRFLELVRDEKIAHARLGKLVLVEVSVLLAAIGALARSTSPEAEPVIDDVGDLESADDVLAAMGLRPVAVSQKSERARK